MSFSNVSIWAPAPTTQRASPVHLSADSKGRLAYASNKSIYVRDLANPSHSAQYNGHMGVTSVAKFSPSGFYIASGDVTGTVRVWDSVGADMNLKTETKVISGRINDIAWDGDSQRIIAVGDGKERFGHAFTYDSGNTVGEISGHSGVINAVAISPNRPFRAATVSDDTQLVFYHGPPFRYNSTMRNHSKFVYDVAFSPDGKTLVSVGADAKIFLYDGKSGESKGSLTSDNGHTGSIFAVGWNKSSSRLVTASADQSVKLWDVEADKIVQTWSFGSGMSIPHQQVGTLFTTSSAAPIVSLSLSGALNYLDPSSPKPIRSILGHQKPVNAMGVTNDHKTIFTGSYDGRVCAWDVATGDADVINENGGGVLQFTASEKAAWSISHDDVLKDIDIGNLSLGGSTATGSTPKGLTVQNGDTVFIATIKDIQISQKGKKLVQETTKFTPSAIAANPAHSGEFAVGAEDTKVYIYIHSGSSIKLKTMLTSTRAQITSLAYSPSGDFLAVGDASGKIILYTVSSGEYTVKTSRWSFHVSRVTALQFNAAGTHCVSCSLDTNVYIWSTQNVGKYIAIKNASKDGVWGVCWIGDKRIASTGGDAAIKIWDLTM